MGLDVCIAALRASSGRSSRCLEECASLTKEHGGTVTVRKRPKKRSLARISCMRTRDVYGIKGAERDRRMKALMPFQVTPS